MSTVTISRRAAATICSCLSRQDSLNTNEYAALGQLKALISPLCKYVTIDRRLAVTLLQRMDLCWITVNGQEDAMNELRNAVNSTREDPRPDVQKLPAEVHKAMRELEDLRAYKDAAERKFKEHDETIEDLTSHLTASSNLKKLISDLSCEKLINSELEKAREADRKKIVCLESRLDQRSGEVDAQRAKINELNQRAIESNDRYVSMKAEIDRQDSIIAELRAKVEDEKKRNGQWSNLYGSLRNQYLAAQKDAADYRFAYNRMKDLCFTKNYGGKW